MDDIITLELSYGLVKIYNLRSIWIQKQMMGPGYMLCYDDDQYTKGIIYRSSNYNLLLETRREIYNSLESGKKYIKVIR